MGPPKAGLSLLGRGGARKRNGEAPKTVYSWLMISRSLASSASVRSFTRVSGLMPASLRILLALVRPPVRGQRSKTNARTRKGPKRTVANKKK